MLDVRGSLQLLNSSHVRERDKALLHSIMVGGVWNCFFLSKVGGLPVSCRFCGALMVMDISFGNVPFLLLLRYMRMDKAHWRRCLLWHGWLPMLSGVNGASPWAADASEGWLFG